MRFSKYKKIRSLHNSERLYLFILLFLKGFYIIMHKYSKTFL